jgi:hypothetical protein
VVVKQLSASLAAVLPTAVGVDKRAGREQLGPKIALQGRGKHLFGHRTSPPPAS